MSTAVIIMILLGVCMIGVSFLIKDDNREINSQISQVNTPNQNIELTDKQKEDIKSQINNLIEEQLNSIDDRTEASLDRISNTKILEMNEYADTIMNEISRNHNETVFLYDMLNEKAKEVKGTVKDVNIATEQVKKIQSASLGLEKNDSDVAAQKDKAKSRLKELSKQSDTAEKSPDMRTKAGNQAENLSSMMEKGRMTEHTEDTVFTGSITDDTQEYVDTISEAASNNIDMQADIIKADTQDNHDTDNMDSTDTISADNKESDNSGNSNGDKNKNILEMNKMGFNAKEIARKMGIGTGEVQLVIDLYSKK